MNIWEKNRKRSKITTSEIANAMNIDEKIVKQIESGVREMPKEKIDEYLATLYSLSKKDRELKVAEARTWYENANFKQLLKEFGIKSQTQFADIIGNEKSTISLWFTKKGNISTNNLMKLYYYFNNGFNKIVEESEIEEKKEAENEKTENKETEVYISTATTNSNEIVESVSKGALKLLQEENKKLKQQIARYEALIDMAIDKGVKNGN